ncbi:MAG: hypothetical protein JXR69_07605 [Candidatus Delongbacteria bacterium]|nr:hypothetical protein [Candidatus Delongbacteria bacterium]
MWEKVDGNKVFRYSVEDHIKLSLAAEECQNFLVDDEDEIIDDSVSCQNCAYRRWGENTIYCMRTE